MDKEKLKKLQLMVEYVGEKNNLSCNELVVLGSVFGKLEAEILHLQEELEKEVDAHVYTASLLSEQIKENEKLKVKVEEAYMLGFEKGVKVTK